MALALVMSLAVVALSPPAAAAAAPSAKAGCPTERPDKVSAVVTARLCKKPIGVTEATTESDELFANPNGTFEWRHSYRAKRVMRNGAWVPVDTTLRFDLDGSVVPTATKANVRFSGGGVGPLVMMTVDDKKVELGSPLGELPKPTLKGATATYPNVLPDVDLELTADVDGYSQVLVVKNRAAARNPLLARLEFITATTGLSFKADGHGNVALVDKSGKPVLRASRPRLWDDATAKSNVPPKANNRLRTKPMRLEVGADRVAVTPDAEVLDDPDTVYPVRIDPGMSLGVGNWALVFSDDPWAVYYDPNWDAQSGTWNGGGQVARTFFEMWPDQAWTGKQIVSATFNMWETWAYSCTARPVELWWTGAINGSTSWNAQPGWIEREDTANTAHGYTGSCPAANVGFNVTSLIQRAAAGNWTNVTLGLIASNESDSIGWKRFDPNASISVTYNSYPYVASSGMSPATACITGAYRPFMGTTTPTLQTGVADPDGGTVKALTEVWPVGGSSSIYSFQSPLAPSGTVVNATVPSGKLVDGGSYMWRTTVNDTSLTSADGVTAGGWSPWCEFTVDTTKPGAPFVSSTLYPPITTDNTWGHGGAGQGGQVTFRAAGSPGYPVGAWSFNEGTGTTAADSSGNNHPLAMSGGAGWSSGQAGSALALNGPRTTLLPATGAVQSIAGRGGRCMDVTGGATNNGAVIQLYDCTGGGRQVWQPQSNGSLKNPVSGRCLDIYAGNTANNTTLELWDCNGGWNQVWQRQPDGSLKNPGSGRCVDASGWGTGNATALLLYDCTGNWNQHWQPQADGSLVSARADQCVDVTGGATADGTSIEGWNCNGGTGQQWQWQGDHSLVNPQSGKCADVTNSGTANGTLIQLHTCNGSGAQVWEPQPDGSLRNPNSGRCLDAGTSAGNGNQLVIWDCTPAAVSQRWVDAFTTASAVTAGPTLNTSQSFSVSAWVRPSKIVGGWRTALSTDSVRTGPFGLGLDDVGQWTLWVHPIDSDSTASFKVSSPTPPVANVWVQLVGVYDAHAGSIKLYVNGILAATTTGVPALFNATGGITLGRSQWAGGGIGYFPGDVDDVNVYGRALTDAEIAGTDTVGYRYQLDNAVAPTDIAATGDATVTITPSDDGRRTLTVYTRDRAGNLSNPTTYTFNVGRAGMTMPAAGATTVKRMKLALSADPLLTNATFQYRRGPGGAEYDIPLANLHNADGSTVTANPVALADLGTNAIWDAVDTLGSTGGVVQVRAQLYTGGGGQPAYTTQWVTTNVDPNGDGAASDSIGPGSVNLLTGDYTVSASDAGEFGLTADRVASSLLPSDGWLPQGQRLSANQQQVVANYPSMGPSLMQSSGWADVSNQMVCDFDGDGKADIIGVNSLNNLLLWRSTSTTSAFSFAPYLILGTGWDTLPKRILGDFDGDGKIDIGGYSVGGADLWIHRNISTPGNPAKAAGVYIGTGWTNVTDQRAVDWDGDGKADIIGRDGDNLLLWRSTSTPGSFSFAPYVSLGNGWSTQPTVLPLADFDGDGKPDLAAFDTSGDALYVHRNTSTVGNPSIGSNQLLLTGWANVVKSTITVADYDNDGKADIIGRDGDNLQLWRSSSNATSYSLLPYYTFRTGWSQLGKFLTADFDGDAKPDVSAYTADNADFWMYQNTSLPDGFTSTTATITKVSERGQGSTKNALELVPTSAGADTYATIGGDNGAMRLGMQAGKRYRITGWINVPAATGLSPDNTTRGLRIVGLYKDASGYHEVASSQAAWVDGWQELTVDVAIPNGSTEAFVRLYNGFAAGSGKKVYWDNLSVTEVVAPYGPQWRAGTGGGAADNPFTTLTFPSADVAKITMEAGDAITFAKNTTTGDFFPQPGAESLSLLKINDTTYRLSGLDGSVYEFGLQGSSYVVTSTWTVDAQAIDRTRYIYDLTDNRALVTRVIAGTEPGVGDCTTTTPARGCQTLDYDYATSTTATSTTFGDYIDQVRSLKVWSWDPDLQAMVQTEVAHYAYDDTGRLRQFWDPRVSPNLVTAYDYDSAGHVTTITPAGQLPWIFDYGTITGDSNDGRLHRVRRPALQQGSPTVTDGEIATRIVYDVPLTRAAGGPNDMDATTTGTWGQRDLPTDATAIFGPEDDPTVVQATSTTPGANGFTAATVRYLNASAQEINTATPQAPGVTGAAIDTVQYDQFGNTVWTLQATNRLLALGQLPNAPNLLSALGLSTADTATRAGALATVNKYSPDGTDLVDTLGPTMSLVLEQGLADPDGSGPLPAIPALSTVVGRAHIVNIYNENPPDGTNYHLVTTTSSGAAVAGYPDADVRVTQHGYNPDNGSTSGWVLREPTSVTTDAGTGGVHLTAHTVYDSTGRATASWGIDSTGTDARTTLTIFYTAGANSQDAACGNRPEWAGDACVTKKAGAVTGADPARMTTNLSERRITSYSRWGDPAVVTETVPGTSATRTTTTSYDPAGRVSSVAITSSGDGATAVPTTTTDYSTINGQATVTHAGATTITREYDTLGRVYRYTDADGAVTTNEYDRYGKPSKVTNPTGYTTFTYDRGIEPRGFVTSVTDSIAGTFTAGYSPDGQMTTLRYPNGITRTDILDTNLDPVGRTYTRDSDGAALWSESVITNSQGQAVNQTYTGGGRVYTYDRLGRLVSTAETTSNACTTRVYSYDNRTNRTNRSTYNPNASGTCRSTGTADATTPHAYDTADRITDPGYTYDAFGRITAVPGGLTNTYYANDLVAGQVLGSNRQDFTLDSAHRFRGYTTATLNGGTWSQTASRLNHYSDDSDSPRWIVENTTTGALTRMVSGPDGTLAATTTAAAGSAQFQLVNLHGDVITTTDATAIPFAYNQYDEFGNPEGSQAQNRYGWLGGKQRSAEALGGVVLMGVRLYHTDTGRFLQPDPVPGGSATAYDYCNADPVNTFDLAGTWPSLPKWAKTTLSVVAKVGEIASYIPGPIGTAAAAISAVSYAATGNYAKAGEMALTAAANLVGCGAVVHAAAHVIVGAVAVAKVAKVAAGAAKVAGVVAGGKRLSAGKVIARAVIGKPLLRDGAKAFRTLVRKLHDIPRVRLLRGVAAGNVALQDKLYNGVPSSNVLMHLTSLVGTYTWNFAKGFFRG